MKIVDFMKNDFEMMKMIFMCCLIKFE